MAKKKNRPVEQTTPTDNPTCQRTPEEHAALWREQLPELREQLSKVRDIVAAAQHVVSTVRDYLPGEGKPRRAAASGDRVVHLVLNAQVGLEKLLVTVQPVFRPKSVENAVFLNDVISSQASELSETM